MILNRFFHRPWMPALLRRLGWMIACILAAIYLNGFPGGFQPLGALAWLFDRTGLLLSLAAILAVVSIVYDKIEWQGVIELRGREGHSWARSLRARVGLLAYAPLFAVIAWSLLDFVQKAWFAADWSRFAVASFFFIDFVLIILDNIVRVLSPRRIVAIEAEGVRFDGRMVPFSSVDRVRVTGDLNHREVTLVIGGRDHGLNLEPIGVSVRTFVERLGSMAPQLPIEWPGRG